MGWVESKLSETELNRIKKDMYAKQTSNLVTVGRVIPECILAANFENVHAARAARQVDPPNEPYRIVSTFYWMDLPLCENRV